MSEKIYIDRKLANDLVYNHNCSDEYDVVDDELFDLSTWDSYHFIVIKRRSDGKLFLAEYARGISSSDAREPFEEDDADKDGKIEFVECEEKQVTRTVYAVVHD